MLTDTLTRELSGVGPEDVPREEQLKKLRSTLELQVQKKSSVVIFVEGTVKKKKLHPPNISIGEKNQCCITLLPMYTINMWIS